MEKSFIAFVEKSIKENWDLDALTDFQVGAVGAVRDRGQNRTAGQAEAQDGS